MNLLKLLCVKDLMKAMDRSTYVGSRGSMLNRGIYVGSIWACFLKLKKIARIAVVKLYDLH